MYRVQSVIRRRQKCGCSSVVFHSIESFQEAVIYTLGSIARHGINGNIVDAAEDAVFDIGIVALQEALSLMNQYGLSELEKLLQTKLLKMFVDISVQ